MRRRDDDDTAALSHRWMLTWSDFVTLLLAVFAVMYAQARQSDNALPPLPLLASSPPLQATGAAAATAQPSAPSSPESSSSTASPENNPAIVRLATALESALLRGQDDKVRARVLRGPEGVLLELDAQLLFGSGDARLSPALANVLGDIAPVLRSNAYPLAIEGHADSSPINNEHYPSNWELSAARAASVARFFVAEGVDETRIEVTGRGTNIAMTDNATPEARRQNRRVNILIRVPGEAVTADRVSHTAKL